MQHTAADDRPISLETLQRAVLAAGHSAEVQHHDGGRRTLRCEVDDLTYVVQFYPSEGHAANAFGAVRFVAWFSDDAPALAVANAYNAEYRFANAVAHDDHYELQHDVIAIGASAHNLALCVQQWATSLSDFGDFIASADDDGEA